jgi:anti-anti-sigma factor
VSPPGPVLDFLTGRALVNVTNLKIVEQEEENACIRLVLVGELDLASTGMLEDRLAALRAEGPAVRLDLSQLEFIDSTGLQALIQAMNDADANGWQLQIDRDVTPQVLRLFRLVHFDRLIPGYDSGGH